MAIDNPKQQASPDIQPFALHAFDTPTQQADGALGRAHPHPVANALGWFSLGLGVAECIMPKQIARLIGVRPHSSTTGVIRSVGAREILSGIGMFTQRMPVGWLWARVGGDVMDISLLGSALTAKKTNKTRIAATMAAVVGIATLDALCAQRVNHKAQGRMLHVKESIAINRSPEDLYRIWRDFTNLPQFMPHLTSVENTKEQCSHWEAKAPFGRTVAWDALISIDEPNSLIMWQTINGSQVANAGTVRFERGPAGHGSVIHVELRYMPPGGILGAGIAKLFGRAPEQQIHKDLLHFKQVLETGEIPTTDGQPAGRPSSISLRYDVPARS
jgi:uncharacterized membrane protein